MGTKLAINGFGRIGRCIARALFERQRTATRSVGAPELELVAINDLTDGKTLAHLLRHDSVHRAFSETVSPSEGGLRIGDQDVRCLAERDPVRLPWKELGVDVVLECTGLFRDRTSAGKHLQAGAKKVLISAPGTDVDGTFCYGINHDRYDPSEHHIISNASCTTNCLAPLARVLDDSVGIIKGHMVTVHSYTNDQQILDLPHSDLRRARAAALSMIPTSTGAAKAIGLVMPELKGKLDGTSIRVPTPDVSITCLTAHVKKATTAQAVNEAFRHAAAGPLAGILRYEETPLVSSDFIGSPYSAILDAALTQVVGDDLVEVQAWYDNEWGFSQRMLDMAGLIGRS